MTGRNWVDDDDSTDPYASLSPLYGRRDNPVLDEQAKAAGENGEQMFVIGAVLGFVGGLGVLFVGAALAYTEWVSRDG